MTFYADLSPYELLRHPRYDDDEQVLNVGWLQRGRDFARGELDPELARALVSCAKRPDRLTRGYHVCDLCDAAPDRMMVVRWDRQVVEVGNGEIRVVDAAGRTYAAPTMIAHYVIDHAYQPPAAFSEAAVIRARSIVTLRDDERAAIAACSPAERFALCLRVVESIRDAHADAPWIADAHAALAALMPLSRLIASDEQYLEAVSTAERIIYREPDDLDRALRDLVRRPLRLVVRHGSTDDSERLTVDMLERAREQGLPGAI